MKRNLARTGVMIGAATLAATISSSGAGSQIQSKHESAVVIVRHIERPVGRERYQLDSDKNGIVLNSDLDFTDRGSRIQLTSTLRLRSDFAPIHFQSSGKTYRFVNVDTNVDVPGGVATVRNFSEASHVNLSGPFFTARGYAPFAGQALMVRYWEAQGRPLHLTVVPGYCPY